jgi:hypothetical protein
VIALPLRLALALIALAVSGLLFVQLSAEKRLNDARDVVFEGLERGDPRREDAIAELLDVADLQPGTEALLLASQARSFGGENERGAALARRAIDREPRSFSAWATLGLALRDLDPRAARRAFEHASRLNPRSRKPPSE